MRSRASAGGKANKTRAGGKSAEARARDRHLEKAEKEKRERDAYRNRIRSTTNFSLNPITGPFLRKEAELANSVEEDSERGNGKSSISKSTHGTDKTPVLASYEMADDEDAILINDADLSANQPYMDDESSNHTMGEGDRGGRHASGRLNSADSLVLGETLHNFYGNGTHYAISSHTALISTEQR